MNKSEIVAQIAEELTHIPVHVIDRVTREIIHQFIHHISSNQRVEIRGFGSFSLNYRAQRLARNPKTGEVVVVKPKYIPYFKPGKDLKERVNHVDSE